MDNEELPYRSAVGIDRAEPVSEQDENDYSTLEEVKEQLDQAIIALYKDFNAFDLSEKGDVNIKIQIKARQVAYDILAPLQATINSTIDDIKVKNEG